MGVRLSWLLVPILVVGASSCGQDPLTFVDPTGPNFVLVLTDDQDLASVEHMPRLREYVAREGVRFSNAFVTNPVCCPSRASILRGQYPHNHGVWTNTGDDGGIRAFQENGNEASTIATWLDDAGYHTMLAGKYLNGYGDLHIPEGWDKWYGKYQDGLYFRYEMNENGRVQYYGVRPGDYEADVIRDHLVKFVLASAQDDRPFFALITPFAPHDPATPAPRHTGSFQNINAPRSPSFNEADVSDKPDAIRGLPPLDAASIESIDELYQRRLESLLAVDELIEALIRVLGEADQLDDTYIIFTSDNGYHLGDHRLPPGKSHPYEQDIRVPMVIRGPGIGAGQKREELVLNIDLAPTIAELAGVVIPGFVDGRSLVPLFGGPVPNWRSEFLVEQRWFQSVRTIEHKFVRYANGERELYDLVNDPYELENLDTQGSPLADSLLNTLEALENCAGAGCGEIN